MNARAHVVCGLLLGLGAGCGDGTSDKTCGQDRPITYEADVAPLVARSCTTCHSSTAIDRRGAPASVNFDTYDACCTNAEHANVHIQEGAMPPAAALPDQDKCVFQAWVDGGLQRN
ncbi:MAG: hypothetical protein HY903_03855 [Deltaproteobacteria bacterium]|nr:hypothetical protein [Deltaproteobacteria bacterium]